MARTVTARGRSSRQVTSLSTRIAKMITAMGGRVGKTVHGRTTIAAVTGVCAITLVMGTAGRAAASPPLGEDVTGTSAITLTMGVASEGTVIAPVSGVGAITLDFATEAHGLAFAPVTGTSAITLDLGVAGVGQSNGVSGVGAITLGLGVAGVGTHIPLVTGAGAMALPLGVAGAGTFYPMVVGTSAINLTIGVAGVGTGATGNAPASVTAPIVGTSRAAQWALLQEGAAGPRTNFANGAWNTTYAEAAVGSGVSGAAPNDPYLASLGFIYDNYGFLWLSIAGLSRTIADYDFDGAPGLSFYGDGASVLITDCANFSWSRGKNVNQAAVDTQTINVQVTRCDQDETTWSLNCQGVFEYGPYNTVRNQAQTLGFGGGNFYTNGFVGINCHHNKMTGGGCNSGDGSHVEWWQQIVGQAGTGSYCYIEDNIIDFSQDDQSNPANTDGWTAVASLGGDMAVKFNRNVVKGIDIVQKLGVHPPGGMGTIIGYGDEIVTRGFEFNDNAISYNPAFPPTYKHGGGSLKPSPTGNRWFRDADSDAAGCVGPADNVALTLADFG